MLNFVFYSQPYNDLSVNLTRKPKLQNATAEFVKFFLRGTFSMSIDGDSRPRHAKKPGSDRFCEIGPAAACMADRPEHIAPKSPQEHRPGSAILSELIINKALISRNAPKSASLFRRNERHY